MPKEENFNRFKLVFNKIKPAFKNLKWQLMRTWF